MKSINQWLAEYGESHQNGTNKLIHWICVPLIYYTIIGLLYSIPVNFGEVMGIQINVGTIIAVLVFLYYTLLSVKVAVGMLFFTVLCLIISEYIFQMTGGSLGLAIVCGVLFVIAWIFQFIGHNIEGQKPSFLEDLQFLMIGPAWVISFIYKKVGIEL